MIKPIKVLEDRRVDYLVALEISYKELGYSTKLDMRCNTLEVFPKGYLVPKNKEEIVLETWID